MIDWGKRAEERLEQLVNSDRQVAELRVKWERDKRKAKRIHEAIFLRVTGTVAERNALAETDETYQSAQAAEMTSLLEYEALRNQRDTSETVIDFWRSWNREKGNV